MTSYMLWNLYPISICVLFCEGVHQVDIHYSCQHESSLQYAPGSNLCYGKSGDHMNIIVHFNNLACGVESKVTLVPIHASSNVITLTDAL